MGEIRAKGLYLSALQDTDLISILNQIGAKKFAKAVKESLRMLCRPGYDSSFIREISKDIDMTYELPKPVKPVRIELSLASEKDEDIRGLLKSTKPRKASIVIKSAIRFAFGPYVIIGLNLIGDEKLCKKYAEKGLFFAIGLESKKTIVKTVVKEKEEKPKVTKKETLKPVISEPIIEKTAYEPIPESDELSDDDFLAMLSDL